MPPFKSSFLLHYVNAFVRFWQYKTGNSRAQIGMTLLVFTLVSGPLVVLLHAIDMKIDFATAGVGYLSNAGFLCAYSVLLLWRFSRVQKGYEQSGHLMFREDGIVGALCFMFRTITPVGAAMIPLILSFSLLGMVPRTIGAFGVCSFIVLELHNLSWLIVGFLPMCDDVPRQCREERSPVPSTV